MSHIIIKNVFLLSLVGSFIGASQESIPSLTDVPNPNLAAATSLPTQPSLPVDPAPTKNSVEASSVPVANANISDLIRQFLFQSLTYQKGQPARLSVDPVALFPAVIVGACGYYGLHVTGRMRNSRIRRAVSTPYPVMPSDLQDYLKASEQHKSSFEAWQKQVLSHQEYLQRKSKGIRRPGFFRAVATLLPAYLTYDYVTVNEGPYDFVNGKIGGFRDFFFAPAPIKK